MKAAVFREVGHPLSIETVPDPTPGPTELVIKTARCGVCGTDISMATGHAEVPGANSGPRNCR